MCVLDLMKIRPVEPELFYVDVRSERHEKGNADFRNRNNSPKNKLRQS